MPISRRDVANDISQWRTIKTAASEAIVRAGGTISHHHDVGEDHVGVLNPGKMVM